MKKYLLGTFLAFIMIAMCTNDVKAQNYDSAVGAKLGYGLMGSYKKFITEKSAVELFGGFGFWGGLTVGGFYQIHKDIESVDNLQWYIGGGAIAGTGYYSSGFELSAHFDLGLDYAFDDLPINVSLDWAPGFIILDSYDDFYNPSRFRGSYGALTVRYILDDM